MNTRISILITLMIVLMPLSALTQNYSYKKKFGTQKNAMYLYWGYNRAIYSKSDITFYSADYNFTVRNATAKDRPVRTFNTYVNPSTLTVPQFNIRLGWYYKGGWDVSLGYDHMKYVMRDYQNAYINGDAGTTTSSQLSGTYSDLDGLVLIRPQDLHYENSNGLNYVSIQLNNTASIYKTNDRKFAIQRRIGMGLGPVITQTDFTWDGQEYHSGQRQKFAGYGISLHTGVRFDFFNRFFLQSNWSGGFIHLPKNATIIELDHFAKQKFIYGQWELLGGVLFYIRTKNGCDSCPDWN